MHAQNDDNDLYFQVCIFAYGQTGSGKTYTMMGRPGNSEQKGLIPRSLEQIFQTRQSLQNQGWKYEMQVSIKVLPFFHWHSTIILLLNTLISMRSVILFLPFG